MNKKIYIFLLVFFTSILIAYQGHIKVAKATETATFYTPENFRVLERTLDHITLTWSTVPDATKYLIYKWEGDHYQKYGPDIPAGTLTFTDINLYCHSRDYGDFYKITAKNAQGDETPQSASLNAPPENDDFADAIDLKINPGMPGNGTFNTCNATLTYSGNTILDPQVEECNLNQGKATVWYQFTADATDIAFSFDTLGAETSYDTFIAVWTGTEADFNNGNLTFVACNNDASGSLQSQVAFQPTVDTTYYIEVGQYDGVYGTLSSSALLGKPWE